MTSGPRNGEKPGPALDNREALELASQRRRRFLVFCCLLVAALLGGNLLRAAVLMTRETRSYCLVCHRGSGPALLWEASERHAEGLSCGQCHGSLPGREGRFGAFSARPDTVNPHCIGCHGSVLDGRPLDKVVEVHLQASNETGAGPRIYRWRLEQLMYDWHLKNRVCLCTDCHRNVSHERESKAFGHRPKMSYCRACHYHAVKDDYVMISPLPMLEIKEEGSGVSNQGSDPPYP